MMPTTRVYPDDASGAQDPIALDYLPTSSITAAVTIPAEATATVAVQVSLDNVFDEDAADYVAPASARWFDLTLTDDWLTFPGPWRAIRLNISSTDAEIVFQVAQATTPRA